MTLPNVNEWMTSLSSLQIVPPPQHPSESVCNHDGTGSGKEPPVPSRPVACHEEERDDANTRNKDDKTKIASRRQQSTLRELNSTSVIRSGDRSIGMRDDRRGVENSANGGDVDKDSIVATAAVLARGRATNSGTNVHHRRQRSLSRKDHDLISTATRSNASPSAECRKKKTSSKIISDLLSTSNKSKQDHNMTSQPMIMLGTQRVYPRTLVQPTIHHSAATDLWIATIHTDTTSTSANDASNNDGKGRQKAFSFHDEKAARASAYANSPPVPVPFGTNSQCMLCDTSFAFLRRPKHCKNCGIVICADCSTRWNMKMLPEAYTNKSTLGLGKTVRVCVSCDAVAKRFKNALVLGRYDMALESYLTGNVNLRCPFVFKGEKEVMFPIHCAILGQSERLLRWLIDVQCCPIHLVSTANKGKKSYEEDALPTLLTSKGRSVMDIAMETKHVGILRYLVKERGVSVHEVKDLSLVLGALEAIIMDYPEEIEDVSTGKENRCDITERNGLYNSTKADGKWIASPVKQQNANEKSGGNSIQQRKSYTHQTSMTAHSTYQKVLIPRDIQAVKEGGSYEAVGRPDFKSAKIVVHDEKNFDDDCSVSTTVNEMVCVIVLIFVPNRSVFLHLPSL
ncbi:hypothetical protein HJC23_010322 [Cyclotella cryptica]|uniref:FYVE-type domain-containing protein n=1 Tax=Cyclotella cryptica TaxID=29204 RepID=A0ABD3QNL0_9STRA|eukprot:CCRYP_003740-RB/>CCRYP_003740-RB protein AED:0.07 eAED:0.07 QI:416/1/1/1/1/1/2/1429/624